jgi:hypothetical protein
MHLHNADVVKKFIFRYLSVPLTDGYWNIFMDITNKDIPNKSSLRVVDELNKFLNNVCIIWVYKCMGEGDLHITFTLEEG